MPSRQILPAIRDRPSSHLRLPLELVSQTLDRDRDAEGIDVTLGSRLGGRLHGGLRSSFGGSLRCNFNSNFNTNINTNIKSDLRSSLSNSLGSNLRSSLVDRLNNKLSGRLRSSAVFAGVRSQFGGILDLFDLALLAATLHRNFFLDFVDVHGVCIGLAAAAGAL